MELKFDPEKHSYMLGEAILPSVTQVILSSPKFSHTRASWWHMDRGSKLHTALAYYDQNDLDERTVDEVLKPYIWGYSQFRAIHKPEILEIEKPFASARYGFAGTLDRLFKMEGVVSVLDIKSGPLPEWINLQLAAYQHLAIENGIDCKRRYGLRLMPNMNFRLRNYYMRGDFDEFLRLLASYKKPAEEAKEVEKWLAQEVPNQDWLLKSRSYKAQP